LCLPARVNITYLYIIYICVCVYVPAGIMPKRSRARSCVHTAKKYVPGPVTWLILAACTSEANNRGCIHITVISIIWNIVTYIHKYNNDNVHRRGLTSAITRSRFLSTIILYTYYIMCCSVWCAYVLSS